MVKIILDCLGGDHSPDANVQGAVSALAQFSDLSLVLVGDQSVLTQKLSSLTYDKSRISIVHAPEVVSCSDKPTDAIRLQKDSSLVKTISLLRQEDDACAMVSLGSTGVVLAGAVLRIGRLKNVIRPAFCPVLPTMHGSLVGVCDSGANVETNAAQLCQFAVMGSLYLQQVYGIEAPRTALLNVGTEPGKGDLLRQAAYTALEKLDSITFAGNMESRELLSGKFDLVVCDGFSGNVLLKSTEGACLEMLKLLKRDIGGSFHNKVGALFLRKTLLQEKTFLDYQNYGGSVMLGTKKIIVKGHGSSKAIGVQKCIEQAYRMQKSGLSEKIADAIAQIPSLEDLSSACSIN